MAAAPATYTSMVATAVLSPPRANGANIAISLLSASPYLSPLPLSSSSVKLPTVSRKSSAFRIRAYSTDESPSLDANQVLTDLKEKWDAVDNKSTVILYGGGAIVALWLTSVIVGAIDSVPLLPKILELIGLGYTGWFVYRYLVFKSSRKELAEEIESLKKRITGAEQSSLPICLATGLGFFLNINQGQPDFPCSVSFFSRKRCSSILHKI